MEGVYMDMLDVGFKPKGQVRILIDGVLWHETSNLVVIGYKQSLTDLLLFGVNPTGYLKSFALGTGGVESSDPSTPVPPVFTDLALSAKVFEKDITEKTVVTVTTLNDTLFSNIIVDRNEANSVPYWAMSEAGLVTAAGNLFARVTFPVVYKTPDRRLTFEWRIRFE